MTAVKVHFLPKATCEANMAPVAEIVNQYLRAEEKKRVFRFHFNDSESRPKLQRVFLAEFFTHALHALKRKTKRGPVDYDDQVMYAVPGCDSSQQRKQDQIV